MLEIKNLQYKYEQSKEFYTYSLNVKASEIVGIVGQSGSGKSTLLDLISGFLESYNGNITLNGNELSSMVVEKRPFSILFQKHNLFKHLNVKKNILLGLKKEHPNQEEKVKNILKEVGLENFTNTLVSKLSGGQQQRVAIARVLLRKEPILLLDEPFTGLDEETRLSMLKLIKKISIEYNLHTIMVTHELNDCQIIANKVYKMQDYKLISHSLKKIIK